MELIHENYGIEHVEILLLIIPATIILYHYLRKDGMTTRKWIFLLSRLALITLITAAITNPYTAKTIQEYADLTSITILSDQSKSMETTNMNKNLTEKIYNNIKTAIGNYTGKPGTIELRYFSEGDRTEIGNTLYQETLKENKQKNMIILLSDGNNNHGRNTIDMAQILGNTNTTIYALLPEQTKNDIYIKTIDGDKKTPANADYTIKIDVGKIGDTAEYNLQLRVDDNLIHVINNVKQETTEKTFLLTFTMKDPGIHKITAEIKPKNKDFQEINNEKIKSVDVVERPDILLITEKENTQLSTLLRENYDLTLAKNLRQDYSKYDTVYLDNQPAEKLDTWTVTALHNYITEGNGIVVVGGENSYERGDYHNSRIETLLPVISTEPPEKKRKEITVIFLIDISQSTGYGVGGETKVDVEKALAINILQQLDSEDNVGAIAFNIDSYTISPVHKLEDVRLDLENKIKSLRFGGGTDMMAALVHAERLLQDSAGDQYLILISDGVIKRRAMQQPTLEKIKAMNEKGVTIYTVGVGFDTDETFMSALAEAGNGLYFRPGEYERLKLEFEEKDKEEKDQYSLGVYNKYHFITRDLAQFWPTIKEYNGVTEKSIAQVLITTEGKMPIVTVWRFGLGRVVSLTTDNGLQWAPNIYYVNNGELVSSITNWAIGNLEKRKRVNIETWDINLGREAEIQIKSEKKPSLIIQDKEGHQEEITLKQTDIDLYQGKTTPVEEGFYMMKAISSLGEDTDAIAVDIPIEYRELGTDLEELTTITALTHGRIYNTTEINQLEEDVLEYAIKGSYRETLQKTPLQIYFITAALTLFFLDVVTRRILDIIRLRRKKG